MEALLSNRVLIGGRHVIGTALRDLSQPFEETRKDTAQVAATLAAVADIKTPCHFPAGVRLVKIGWIPRLIGHCHIPWNSTSGSQVGL
jgi:hypothetical protein